MTEAICLAFGIWIFFTENYKYIIIISTIFQLISAGAYSIRNMVANNLLYKNATAIMKTKVISNLCCKIWSTYYSSSNNESFFKGQRC